MKSRTLFFAFVVFVTTFVMSGTASAQTNRSCDVPSPAPGFSLLYPTSSTHVLPGETVSLAFNYQHVQPYPWTKFFFKSLLGNEQVLTFNPKQSNTLTVPVDWKPGWYRLTKTQTFNVVGWTGTQTREHVFVGRGPDAATVFGYSCVDLKPIDLWVRAPGS